VCTSPRSTRPTNAHVADPPTLLDEAVRAAIRSIACGEIWNVCGRTHAARSPLPFTHQSKFVFGGRESSFLRAPLDTTRFHTITRNSIIHNSIVKDIIPLSSLRCNSVDVNSIIHNSVGKGTIPHSIDIIVLRLLRLTMLPTSLILVI
jgi:hypothetical protein